MGFTDANWAYGLDLPMAQKVVLAAVCQRTDDRTHTTLVGQQTVAEMIGASVDTVRRAVGALERLGIITRAKRHRANGARNSDAITVDVTYTAERLQGAEPTRQTTNKADSGDLPDSVQPPTRQSAGGNGVNQIDQPDNQSELIPNDPEYLGKWLESHRDFTQFWQVWPRKNAKKDAEKSWASAIKRASPQQIYDAAAVYAAHPHRPARQYVPYAATWLRSDRWNDPPPEAPEADRSKPTPTDRARAILALVPDMPQKEIS